MQIRKPCENKGSFRTKMIWKINVRFRATSGSSLRQDRGRQKAGPDTACAHLRSTTKKNCPAQLLTCIIIGERKKLLYLPKFFRAFRTAGADAKRNWRILGRVWKRGSTHLPAGLPTAGTRRTHEVRSVFCRFAPAAYLWCNRICGACGNDC